MASIRFQTPRSPRKTAHSNCTFFANYSGRKHPIVLPKNHQVTKLIINHEHIDRLHAGANATLYGVRENYWPLDGRNTTRKIIRQCVRCFRARPCEVTYLMGNLPKNRLSFPRSFIHVGVDYCGSFYTKVHRHRNRTKIKTYVSVFVCFATNAVHLELANDLTQQMLFLIAWNVSLLVEGWQYQWVYIMQKTFSELIMNWKIYQIDSIPW